MQDYLNPKSNLCDDCILCDTGSCEDAKVKYDSQRRIYSCSVYLKGNQDFIDTMKILGLTAPIFFTCYDQQDREWMLDTKKHPPTSDLLTSAFNKYISGYRPGDELWTEDDQDAYIYSMRIKQ